MYGAIIGDLAGSIYEYEQTKQIKSIKANNIIEKNAFYSDDTILTIAILDAILNDRNFEYYLKKYIEEYKSYKPDFYPYFDNAFSLSLIKWQEGKKDGISTGNGALMRISPVGFMFDDKDDVIKYSYLSCKPSHNTREAINCAMKMSLMIYYFRKQCSKDDVYNHLNLNKEYKPFEKFNTTCDETFNNCLYAFYISSSFEDAIRNTLLMGGDTDTNCAITGALAESYYGISEELIDYANSKIPKEFVNVLTKSRRIVK